jgi:hypothetical protein
MRLHVNQHHVATFLHKTLSNAVAEALCATGDDGGFVLQAHSNSLV